MEGNIRVDGNAEVERHAANLRMQGCMSVLKKQTKAEDDANGGGAMERKWRISICSHPRAIRTSQPDSSSSSSPAPETRSRHRLPI
ncbi:uncharacterized protein STEHIDRAFT_155034 [Stereum hirsutum FP-91666 SS1]|uniref:uncharacterized protein n=1 Tax=Stereum hirsutum (strain FP-91666) TaxID=721885 RepID=UPI000440E537|nr:uncharacterized protein STEHIDRAFT_155034 [Stereum hirsutum FP-91666 SS1]EIM89365.1 hypothetical protein STEHIDRAFT_155034 [Stereum hirsutum FP-91666 SS1]